MKKRPVKEHNKPGFIKKIFGGKKGPFLAEVGLVPAPGTEEIVELEGDVCVPDPEELDLEGDVCAPDPEELELKGDLCAPDSEEKVKMEGKYIIPEEDKEEEKEDK